MRIPTTPLEQCILEEGLEDLIPLPEIVQTVVSRGLSKQPSVIDEVANALKALVLEGRVQVWAGRWPGEPKHVAGFTAESLLADPGQYHFNSATDISQRVYYVNVDNLHVEDEA